MCVKHVSLCVVMVMPSSPSLQSDAHDSGCMFNLLPSIYDWEHFQHLWL